VITRNELPDVLGKIDLDDAVDIFSKMEKRRYPLIS